MFSQIKRNDAKRRRKINNRVQCNDFLKGIIKLNVYKFSRRKTYGPGEVGLPTAWPLCRQRRKLNTYFQHNMGKLTYHKCV